MSLSGNFFRASSGKPEGFSQGGVQTRVLSPEKSNGGREQPSFDAGLIGNTEQVRSGARGRQAVRRFLFVFDLCLVFGTSAAVALLPAYKGLVSHGTRKTVFPPGAAGFLVFFSVLVVLFAQTYGLYEVPWKKGLGFDLGLITKSVASAALIANACIYLWNISTVPTQSIALTVTATWLSLVTWRTFIRSQSISGLTDERNVLIVGCGPNGQLLRSHLEQNPHIGYIFKGYIDRRQRDRASQAVQSKEESYILGAAEQLPSIVRRHFIDEVLISVPSDRHLVKEIARHARVVGLNVRVVPDLYDGLATEHEMEYVGQVPAMTLNQLPVPTFQLVVKRLVDIVLAASLLILSMPLLVLIAIAIKLDSKGPVFYRSLRVGKKGRTFICSKFRTMVAESEALRHQLEHLNERDKILFKIEADPRITRVGKFLRKFSLDEWPQLWNVLKQDMSLVGPRPSAPGEYNQYAPEHLRRLDVTPGVTGLWQVTARRDPSFETYVALDKQYVNNWSLLLDCRILLKTIGVVLSGTGQ
jgi:exopolysaccharide biosynthesis polyprenyl glycosylphosphotransferase